MARDLEGQAGPDFPVGREGIAAASCRGVAARTVMGRGTIEQSVSVRGVMALLRMKSGAPCTEIWTRRIASSTGGNVGVASLRKPEHAMNRFLIGVSALLFSVVAPAAETPVPAPSVQPRVGAPGISWCSENPEKCQARQAERAKRMEACRADPQKCAAEMNRSSESWCAANPEHCKAARERQAARAAQCESDPEKCRLENRRRKDQMCAENPKACLEPPPECKGQPHKCGGLRSAAKPVMLIRADTDHNGMLSREEVSKALPALAARFDELDTNKDGQLSDEELKAGGRRRAAGPREPSR